MGAKRADARAGTVGVPELSTSDVDELFDGVREEEDSPPPKKEKPNKQKKLYERQDKHPKCKQCNVTMKAKSTPGMFTLFYCENPKCSNTTGLKVLRREVVLDHEVRRDLGRTPDVRARANMKDVEEG